MDIAEYKDAQLDRRSLLYAAVAQVVFFRISLAVWFRMAMIQKT